MEKTVSIDEEKKRATKRLIFPLIVLAVLSFAWFLCLYQHESWLVVFEQLGTWLINPEIHYTPMQVSGVANAFFATIEIVVLGTLVSHVLLVSEEDKFLQQICAIGLGFGFTGFITILLAEFGMLYGAPLNAIILFSIAGFILVGSFYKREHKIQSIETFLRDSFSIWKLKKPTNTKNYLAVVFPIGFILFLSYYNALLAPIIHWDATTYHAVLPSVMYNYHTIPLIAGTSEGLEMGANYPPLYYALGAYYYTQVGGVEEFYLKAISPTMSLLTILVVFKIGKLINGETFGKISALLLSATPLFILYSMYVTSYMVYVFLVATSILFMLLALKNAQPKYWVVCGIFYGFSLLSNYQAVLLSPFFLAIFFYLFLKKKNRQDSSKFLIPVVAIAGVWYLRNLILLGNPFFPLFYELFGGRYVDPMMRAKIFQMIQEGATQIYFNSLTPSVVERLGTFVFDFQQFPALSLLTFIGIILALSKKDRLRRKWMVLLVWAFLPSSIVLSGMEWTFPRAFLITLPPFAMLSAFPISEALNQLQCKKSSHCNWVGTLQSFWKEYLFTFFLSAMLLIAFLFPGFVMAVSGKTTWDGPNAAPPSDALFYIKNPGKLDVGDWYFGVNTTLWQFLNDHLKEGEKVATFENKLYYIKGGDPKYFFMLDGWKASPLYQITDPAKIVQFLKENNVKYIFSAWQTHGSLWPYLPLTSYLPSEWFPVVFSPDPNATEENPHSGIIYNVGPITEP